VVQPGVESRNILPQRLLHRILDSIPYPAPEVTDSSCRLNPAQILTLGTATATYCLHSYHIPPYIKAMSETSPFNATELAIAISLSLH
jgi:hypothetical protein